MFLEFNPGFIFLTRLLSALLFAPAGFLLKESVIHTIAASSSHCKSSPGLAFLLKRKSISAMSGEEGRRGGPGENFCLKTLIGDVSKKQKIEKQK